MQSRKTLRCRRHLAASRSSLKLECLKLECLESRLALTAPVGNVTARLLGSTLFLTGDALGNELAVASVPGGRIAVLGNATTINGSPSTFVTSRAVTSIIANLNGGNDKIGFGNSANGFASQLSASGFAPTFSPAVLQNAINLVAGSVTTFSLPGNLTVTTAAGDDAVGLIGNVGGSIAVNLGSAASGNGFVIGDPAVKAPANTVGGIVSVVGGAQDDLIALYGTTVAGGVSVALGNGGNQCGVQAYGATIGSFAYTGGTGNDGVFLRETPRVRNGVSIFTGPRGKDEVGFTPTAAVGGSVTVNTGIGNDDDKVKLAGGIKGGVAVTTGGGNDEVSVNAATIGLGLAIDSGAGNDGVLVTASTVGLNAVIDAGAGTDTVSLTGLRVRYSLFVSLHAGNDQLGINNSSAVAAFLYGGSGTNSLTTNAATRAGIRTLRYYRFQTVNNT